jgi:cobalt/nickel transport protein
MRTEDRNLIIAAVILCLVIGILAPFIASSNPDGLEKSAEQLMGNPDTDPAVNAPMSDYSIPGLGKIGEIGAMFAGIFVTLIVAYLVAMLIRRRKNSPESFN